MARPELTASVIVHPLPEQTDPAQQRWAYAYTVVIHNTGNVSVQLIGRHWTITDHHGTAQQVRGLGVVGQQPLLAPGERFEYTSWVQIASPQGSMQGSFFCITEDARWFESPVAEFMLADAASLH